MKTQLIALAAFSTVLFGCVMMEPEHVQTIEQKQITISAYRVDEPETKTQRDESNGSVLWTPGDAISLFYGSGTEGGSRFVSNATEISAVTNFTGTIGVITGGADISLEDTYFWGLYPYDPTAECDGTSIITTLPNQQIAVPSTFASNTFPSLGRSQGLSMGFYNICGGVRITVTRDDIKSVTLKTIGGELIAGRARVGFEGDVPKIMEILDGTDEITITAPAGKFLEPGKFYYFVAFPQALSEGVQFTMESFSESGVFERRSTSIAIKRSIFGNLRNIDQNVVFSEKTGPIPIEDSVLKNWLIQQGHDADSDGEISYQEAKNVTEIRINPTNQYNLQSLKGIEYMPNLEVIDCGGDWYDEGRKSDGINREYYYVGPYKDNWDPAWGPIGTLRYIDVSNNPKLQLLNICNNSALGVEIGTINVTNCPDLNHINVGMTWMEYPDVSLNTELEFVQFTHLRGTLPDLSGLSKVKSLFIEWPQDKDIERVNLDVSHMPDLEVLYVADRVNALSDLSANPKLRELYIWGFPELAENYSLSGCPDLEVLTVNGTNLQSLDVSHNTKLKELYCMDNRLNSLDVSNNTRLEILHCNDNQIRSLSLPQGLKYLHCWTNPLGTLDVSELPELVEVCCARTGLTSLDVTNNDKLVYLAFDDNSVGSIDLSGNPLLEELACWNCGLTALDLSHNPELTWLRCWGNKINILDISKNTKLGTRSTYEDHDNGLACSPMNDEQDNNLLTTLFISPNQTIPFVTENRSNDHIPSQTIIRTVNSSLPIEDPGFRNYLVQNFDTDGNGEISYEEAERIEAIWCWESEKYNIVSLQGIEYMPNLKYLGCAGTWKDPLYQDLPEHYYISPSRINATSGPIGTVRYVDVSCNRKLVYLNVAHNEGLGDYMPKGLDLSNNPDLEELHIAFNKLPIPDISHLTKLRVFISKGNTGSVPDFSRFNNLTHLWVEDPQTDHNYSVDVSNCPDLEELNVQNTSGTVTGFQRKTKLSLLVLKCWGEYQNIANSSMAAEIQEALPNLVNLVHLDVEGMKLTGYLNLFNNTKLKRVACFNNSITEINWPSNNTIEYVNVNWNRLATLDVSQLSSLNELYCDGNPLTILDVSYNTVLNRLGFSNTQITSIDVSNNKELTLIGCDNIPGLTHLDLQHNAKLDGLCIRNDGFSSIDVSHNPLLKELLCEGNTIGSLNVSNNPILEKLSCVQQNDANGNNYLQSLFIAQGQIIPYVTVNRSTDYIPASTVISVAPSSGGGEGTGDDDW